MGQIAELALPTISFAYDEEMWLSEHIGEFLAVHQFCHKDPRDQTFARSEFVADIAIKFFARFERVEAYLGDTSIYGEHEEILKLDLMCRVRKYPSLTL